MTDAVATLRAGTGWLGFAGLCSLGAGAIHAGAVGIHDEHTTLARSFVVVALAQLVVGAAALIGRSRVTALLTALVSSGTVAAWALTRVVGISWIGGLEHSEAPQFTDTSSAALGVGALVFAVRSIRGRPDVVSVGSLPFPIAAAAVIALVAPAMFLAAVHEHGSGHTDINADDHAAGLGEGGHDDVSAHHEQGPSHAVEVEGISVERALVPPVPYDPALPIDLSGVDGVTPQQQAAAENLVAVTLARLPRLADPSVAEAAGFRSIGDAGTGYEHFVNWDYLDDEFVLDADHPESLVFQVIDGERTLVSAMYMLPTGTTLDGVPELGGRLTQWHIHDNLCYDRDPADTPPGEVAQVHVVGLRPSNGECAFGVALEPVPMIHVWIVPHECGPFAALEGVGAGQITDGEQRWCNHAHGSASG